ncbi:MAG: hypothetical protein WB660_10180 [Candidatus Sulfotelmatobacter sp.]
MNPHIGKWLVARPALLAVLVLYTARGATTQLSPSMVVHGSFAVVIICKDGIVVAADSRGTIQNSRGKKLGYYNDVQKVFVLNHNVLAYTGLEAKTQLPNQKLLLAGYSEAGEPTICYFSMAQTVGPAQGCSHRGFIASDHCLLDTVGADWEIRSFPGCRDRTKSNH